MTREGYDKRWPRRIERAVVVIIVVVVVVVGRDPRGCCRPHPAVRYKRITSPGIEPGIKKKEKERKRKEKKIKESKTKMCFSPFPKISGPSVF